MLRSHIKWENQRTKTNKKQHSCSTNTSYYMILYDCYQVIPKIFHHIPDSAPDSYSWHLPWALRVSGYAATRPPARRYQPVEMSHRDPIDRGFVMEFMEELSQEWFKHGSSRGFMMVYVIWKSIKHVPKHQPAICSNREYVLGPTGRKSSTFRHPQISLFFKSPSLTIISLLCHLCW